MLQWARAFGKKSQRQVPRATPSYVIKIGFGSRFQVDDAPECLFEGSLVAISSNSSSLSSLTLSLLFPPMSPSKIFVTAARSPLVLWLDPSIESKKRKSCSKLIVIYGGFVTDIKSFADFSICSKPVSPGASEGTVWADLAWIYDSVAKGVLLDVMKYIPKSASVIDISSDSESDKASGHVLQPKNDSAPPQEISDEPPFTNDEYLALIKFLASIRVPSEDAQWKKFHRMNPQRSCESWSNCVRRNREFFNEQVSLLEAREPFRLVDKFHPAPPKRGRALMYTQKERDAMSKHLSTTKLKWRRDVWGEFHKKYPHRSLASYLRYDYAHPSLEPEIRPSAPAAERESENKVVKTESTSSNLQSGSNFTSEEIQAMIQHVSASHKPPRSLSSWKSFAHEMIQSRRSAASWCAYYMSRAEWFDEQAKSKRDHSEPLTPLLPLSSKPLPDPRRVPSLKRLPSLDACSSLPISRRRRADSPVWEHARGHQPGSAGRPTSSHGHGTDRSDQRSVSLGTTRRAPAVHTEQLCHPPVAEDSKKRSSCSPENADDNLLDILSVLMMLGTESMNPSIEDWIRFSSKNAHRTLSSWINFHETYEKLFRSLVSRLDPPEDPSPAWNNFSSRQALSLAHFLAEQGANPSPRDWRDFSKQHKSQSLESWVAFKNHFGRSLMRLMRENRV